MATFVLKGNNMGNILLLFSLDATIKDLNKYLEKHYILVYEIISIGKVNKDP